jgi:3',5'-cyclic AMP phosphodiesterase CpdA
MNLNYLVKEILPVRKKEIEDGKNIGTRQPIYVVLDLQENIIDGHIHYSPSVNYKGKDWKHGYADRALDSEDMVFSESPSGMENPKEFTKFYTDRVIAFFFTSEAAHSYIKHQAHNLQQPYVYVFNSGYANYQMDMLLNNQ